MGVTPEIAARIGFGAALAVLSMVAFAGIVAVPAEGAAIRRWGRGSRPHRAVNGLLYPLCGATVAAVLYVVGRGAAW